MDINLEQLQKRKKELNMSYDEIAEKSGLAKSTVTNILRGYVKCSRYATIQKIQNALGITGSGYTAEDYADGVRYTKKVSITADQEDIFDKTNEVIDLLGDKGKELIIDFCDMLLEKFGR